MSTRARSTPACATAVPRCGMQRVRDARGWRQGAKRCQAVPFEHDSTMDGLEWRSYVASGIRAGLMCADLCV